MSIANPDGGPEPDADPLDTFSQCHAGILGRLATLAQMPALLDAAARARDAARDMAAFFRGPMFEHHREEEHELFPAVRASAEAGRERDRVQAIVERLTREHRLVETSWSRLEPALEAAAKGREARLDVDALGDFVGLYTAHARYEERVFLPLAQEILGRNGDHMAALGLSMHLRHATARALAHFGHRI